MKTNRFPALLPALASSAVLALSLASSPLPAADKPLTGDRLAAEDGEVIIHPINHATLAIGWKDFTICTDPVGGAKRFVELPRPDLIVLTDIHADHLSAETLKAVAKDKTLLVAPPAVAQQLAQQLPAELRARMTVLTNGQTTNLLGVKIEATAAYNSTAGREKLHPRGRGNGYVLTVAGRRIYLSGDTEDIPEMRALKNIDVAFLCLNQPYTMTVEQGAAAVQAFRPKIVYPYHCRGTDLEKFKRLAEATPGVEIRLRNWYE
jgi:L-ascorbate metabolism protein UlaG (beta-lactamase superfamily)